MRVIVVVAVLIVLALSGCLRTKFDLCTESPPNPECAFLDAGRDAGADGSSDGGPTDGGVDAPAPVDAAADGG